MGTMVVTGANRGIGLELARQLAGRGERVIATARDPRAAALLRALDVRVERLDVGDPASVAAFAAALDGAPVDTLINNAGIGVRSRTLAELDPEELLEFFSVNSVGPLRVVKALLPNLRLARMPKPRCPGCRSFSEWRMTAPMPVSPPPCRTRFM